MNFVDLTQEIYHGHEQEYRPSHPPLSMTDSNPSLPINIWRNAQAPTTKSNPKPVCFKINQNTFSTQKQTTKHNTK